MKKKANLTTSTSQGECFESLQVVKKNVKSIFTWTSTTWIA